MSLLTTRVVDTGGNLPPLSPTLAAPCRRHCVDTSSKFAAGVNDTGVQGTAGVVDTGSALELQRFKAALQG